MMNQGNIGSNHLTLSGSSSSSKTVAAILKQPKDLQSSGDVTRVQQQSGVMKKKGRPGNDQGQQAGSILSQLNMSKGSPQNRVASPSGVASPAMSPSSNRGVSPLGKEHNQPVTTKGPSLSRDLSPSLITAQIVKVMAETTTTSAPNLLRSALQGNIPDPMGILSSSKTEGGFVTVVSSTPGSLPDYSLSARMSPAGLGNLATNSNNISGSYHQGHTFSKILTSIAGAGGYLGQQEVDHIDSLMTASTVENLLASSDGIIQTVNVSHTPKPMNSNSASVGLLAGSSSSAASSSRYSQRSAMEVAQQIKLEANGQKSSARLYDLQQLRSQIQSSRSIDAQFTPKPVSFAAQTPVQRTSPKEPEHKTLEAAMPLLASKLIPSTMSKLAASSSVPSHIKQQQQQQIANDSSVFLSSSVVSASTSLPLLSSSLSSSSSSSSSSTSSAKKQAPTVSAGKQSAESQQQQHVRHLQQSHGLNFLPAKQFLSEPSMLSDHSWNHQQAQRTLDALPATTSPGDLHASGIDKPQTLERLFLQATSRSSSERNLQTDTPVKMEAHVPAVSKQQSAQYGYQRSSLSSHMSSVQATLAGIGPSYSNKGTFSVTGRGMQTPSDARTSKLLSKFKPGESKLTAIDVDLDIGQLVSITGDGASIHTDASACNSSHVAVKDSKQNDLYSFVDRQLCSGPVCEISNLLVEQANTKSKDLQTFIPVQAAKSSSSSTSCLAHIPKPIVHVSLSSSSSSSSSSNSAAAARLPPPPDYIPPPPYPSKLSQSLPPHQQQHQQQQHPSKVGQGMKQSVQNPFTFPTSGVRLHTDPNSLELSYSYISQLNNEVAEPNMVKQEVCEDFHEIKEELGVLGKSHSDMSAVYARHRDSGLTLRGDMPRLIPEVPDVKDEIPDGLTNHTENSNAETRPVVQPFNQRVSNLSCFPVMNSTYRAAYRSHAVAVQRARSGVITNTAKSLDILRQNLQRCINKEITGVIKKYTDKFFQPALENIKQNNNENFVGQEQINYVCRQILEEAKAEYVTDSGRRSVTPSDIPDNVSETGSLGGRRLFLKRSRISDSDSEKGSDGGFKRKFAKKKGRSLFHSSGRSTPSKTLKSGEPIKREGPKWDPERLKSDTLFVMGARANKALGLGNTRGRLYIRHPDVFKYVGDQEDKLWLCEHNLMPPTGGKAYILLLEDIEDLSRTEEYKDSPALMMHECVGFTVPEWMLVKIKEQMGTMRSDSAKRSMSRSPASEFGEFSQPKVLPFTAFADGGIKEETLVSPVDTEEMDFLSTADNDDTQPSSGISPFTVTGGFEDGVSPSPSELDPNDDQRPVTSLFS